MANTQIGMTRVVNIIQCGSWLSAHSLQHQELAVLGL